MVVKSEIELVFVANKKFIVRYIMFMMDKLIAELMVKTTGLEKDANCW